MGLRVLHYADVEVAYDDPERIGRLAGLVGELRDEDTVVSGAGDNVGPGVLSLVTRGRQALDYFRAVDADVDTFGNHDFDHGVDALLDVVDDSPQTWVCANAFRDGERFAAAEGSTPWTVVETETYRVGVVGVAHPETADINPNAADVRFAEPTQATRAGVEALRERDVDRIVVLSHLGDDTELARNVDVDVILGAHDHETLVERVDGTLVCRPGGTGRYLLDVSFDGEQATATHHDVADAPLDATAADALRERLDATGLAETVATPEEPIVCDMLACKRGESRLGNLITDAYRWKTGADVGLNSGGGFRRREPLAGDVTAFDLVSVTPYDSDLLVVRVDGETLMATLRQLALVEAPDDVPRWHFGHVSGAEVVWDDATEELRGVRVDGDPVDSASTYDVVTSEFFVANDELFPSFGPNDVVERCGLQYEAVVEYVRETGLDPELEGRISRPTLPADAIPERDWPNSPD
jgi:2',3'-cyclic-nucleotide 2'-phosphodiesterase (5'-nucleotidase family)